MTMVDVLRGVPENSSQSGGQHVYLHFVDPLTINVNQTVSADDVLKTLIQSIKTEIQTMATDVTTAIAELQADVTDETTVNQSAITLIQGFPALLAAAIAAAQAAGATPAQLQSFNDLSTGLKANTASLAAAVSAGTTPPTPPPQPPPKPSRR